MGTSAIAGYRTPSPLIKPQYDKDMENLAADVELTAVPTVASVGVRDGLYATAIAAGKVGMRCYVTNRAGFSVYQHISTSTKVWVWEPQRRPLAMETRTSDADSSGGNLIDIILTGPFVLPAGNRLIQVLVRSKGVQLTGSGAPSPSEAKPQLQVIGSGFSPGYNDVTRLTTFPGAQTTLENEWYITASGTCSWALRGRDGHETVAQSVRFSNSILQIFDLGPTDF